MSTGIYLIQQDGQLVEMREQPYNSEDLLQRLLADYPNLLAGDQMDSAAPRRWLLVSREMAVPDEEGGAGRWSLDHLFLDQDGVPTLIEVKRSSDTRIRREVVGQMLDYAANAVVYWPVETIRAQFEAGCSSRGSDPEQVLSGFLPPDNSTDEFWQKVKTNLQAQKIRMVFVADLIPTELRRIVEFLNGQMDPAEVLAVEIKQYVADNQIIRGLVPRLIGQSAEAQQKKASSPAGKKRQWDETSFFKALETERSTAEAAIARGIFAWARPPRVTRVWFGQGVQSGSFVPILNYKGRDHQLFAVWTVGYLEVYFQWYQYKPPFDSQEKRLELLNRLNAISGVAIPPNAITLRPSISLSLLKDDTALQQLIETFDWVIAEIKAT